MKSILSGDRRANGRSGAALFARKLWKRCVPVGIDLPKDPARYSGRYMRGRPGLGNGDVWRDDVYVLASRKAVRG